MKKFVLLSFIVALAAQAMMSKSITADQAMEAALQFANQSERLKSQDQNSLQLSYVSRSTDGYTDYYVFNHNTGDGFIIVSGDDRSLPVLGYSDQGSFDFNRLPANMKWWLSEYQRQLQWLRTHKGAAVRDTKALTSSVSPLISTQWDQIYPFNKFCPSVSGGPGGHALTGCLATAMAQLMKYHEHPARGAGDHSYTLYLYNQELTLSADFSQSVYNWDQMLNSYWNGYNTTQEDAVARLMSDVGISIDMEYGPDWSSARYIKAIEALIAYFDYSPAASFLLKDSYHDDWDNLLRSEIDAQRPIFYFGQTSYDYGYEGHAFVVDGYDNRGYFHINWGWGGDCDGYFVSDLFTPEYQHSAFDEGYNTSQGAIVNIEPDTSGAGGLVLKSGIIPGAATMPANDVRVSVEVEAVGGPYEGELYMAIAEKTGEDYYSWSNVMFGNVSLSAGERKTLQFSGSYYLEEGKTYYFFLINPYNHVSNYLWCDAVPFTVGDWPIRPGDVNGDGKVAIDDVTALIDYLTSSGSGNMAADVNGDSKVAIDDVTALIDLLLQ